MVDNVFRYRQLSPLMGPTVNLARFNCSENGCIRTIFLEISKRFFIITQWAHPIFHGNRIPIMQLHRGDSMFDLLWICDPFDDRLIFGYGFSPHFMRIFWRLAILSFHHFPPILFRSANVSILGSSTSAGD